MNPPLGHFYITGILPRLYVARKFGRLLMCLWGIGHWALGIGHWAFIEHGKILAPLLLCSFAPLLSLVPSP